MTQTQTLCDECGKWLPSDEANWMEDGSSYCKTCRPYEPQRKPLFLNLLFRALLDKFTNRSRADE